MGREHAAWALGGSSGPGGARGLERTMTRAAPAAGALAGGWQSSRTVLYSA